MGQGWPLRLGRPRDRNPRSAPGPLHQARAVEAHTGSLPAKDVGDAELRDGRLNGRHLLGVPTPGPADGAGVAPALPVPPAAVAAWLAAVVAAAPLADTPDCLGHRGCRRSCRRRLLRLGGAGRLGRGRRFLLVLLRRRPGRLRWPVGPAPGSGWLGGGRLLLVGGSQRLGLVGLRLQPARHRSASAIPVSAGCDWEVSSCVGALVEVAHDLVGVLSCGPRSRWPSWRRTRPSLTRACA